MVIFINCRLLSIMSSSESSLDSADDFDGFDNDIGREEDDVRNVFEDDEDAGYEAHNLDPLDREANYIDNDEDEDFQITGSFFYYPSNIIYKALNIFLVIDNKTIFTEYASEFFTLSKW